MRGDTVWVKAATTHSVVGKDADVARRVPLLTRVAPHIGHFQIRNRGTLGGVGAPRRTRPASSRPSRWTLDAEYRGHVDDDHPRGFLATFSSPACGSTSLQPGEVLTAVVLFRCGGPRAGFGFLANSPAAMAIRHAGGNGGPSSWMTPTGVTGVASA